MASIFYIGNAGGSQIKGKGKPSKKPSKASNSSKPKSKSHLILSFLHLIIIQPCELLLNRFKPCINIIKLSHKEISWIFYSTPPPILA